MSVWTWPTEGEFTAAIEDVQATVADVQTTVDTSGVLESVEYVDTDVNPGVGEWGSVPTGFAKTLTIPDRFPHLHSKSIVSMNYRGYIPGDHHAEMFYLVARQNSDITFDMLGNININFCVANLGKYDITLDPLQTKLQITLRHST